MVVKFGVPIGIGHWKGPPWFLRYVLGVRKNTNTSMVYFETEHQPLYSIRNFRMFIFWFKIMQSENCILRASYECLYRMSENSKKYCSNWVAFIKEQLYCLGLGYIWNDQNCINSHVCLPIIRSFYPESAKQNSVWIEVLYVQNDNMYRHKVHLEFLRYVLGVRKNTNTSMVYFETGRLPLYSTRIFRMNNYIVWDLVTYGMIKIV